MHLVTKNNERLNFTHQYFDRWLEDIDDFVATEFKYETSKKEMLDCYCAHLAFWNPSFSFSRSHEKSATIWNRIKSDPFLNQLVRVKDGYDPSAHIYTFGGVSIYDELCSENFRYDKKKNIIYIDFDNIYRLILNEEEFKYIGGEKNYYQEEGDYEIDLDYISDGWIYFFQNEDQTKKMGNYLIECINTLNVIYEEQGLQSIRH